MSSRCARQNDDDNEVLRKHLKLCLNFPVLSSATVAVLKSNNFDVITHDEKKTFIDDKEEWKNKKR